MSINEAIAHAREVSKRNREQWKNCPADRRDIEHQTCEQCAEEHEQIAEWLEELKSYRAHIFSGDMTQVMLKEVYNKAIDDFVHECDRHCGFYNGYNKNLTREDILMIAEQLKAGGENEQRI